MLHTNQLVYSDFVLYEYRMFPRCRCYAWVLMSCADSDDVTDMIRCLDTRYAADSHKHQNKSLPVCTVIKSMLVNALR